MNVIFRVFDMFVMRIQYVLDGVKPKTEKIQKLEKHSTVASLYTQHTCITHKSITCATSPRKNLRSPCLLLSHNRSVPLCPVVSRCVPLCPVVSRCVPLCPVVSRCPSRCFPCAPRRLGDHTSGVWHSGVSMKLGPPWL